MQTPIRLPPVRVILPTAVKVNNNPVEARTFNLLDNNGKEAEFLRTKNVSCEFWNNMLSFLPYLNNFIDCYSFFMMCDLLQKSMFLQVDIETFLKFAKDFINDLQPTVNGKFAEQWAKKKNISKTTPCDVLSFINTLHGDDSINFFRCLLKGSADRAKDYSHVRNRLSSLSISIESLRSIENRYDRITNCSKEKELAKIITTSPLPLIKQVWMLPRMRLDNFIELTRCNMVWNNELLSAVMTFTEKIEDDQMSLILGIKHSLCDNSSLEQSITLIRLFSELSQKYDPTEVLSFYQTHTTLVPYLMKWYNSPIFNPERSVTSVYPFHEWMTSNINVIQTVSIHSLFNIGDSRVKEVIEAKYPMTVNIYNNICSCSPKMDDNLFSSVLLNICPLLDNPDFYKLYINRSFSVTLCSNGCIQVSYSGNPKSDKWFKNQREGWSREINKSIFLYCGNRGKRYYPRYGNKPAFIQDGGITFQIRDQIPFVYDCYSGQMRRVYYWSGEGLQLLSNMGVYCILDEIRSGFKINASLLGFLLNQMKPTGDNQNHILSSSRYHFMDDLESVIHPEYETPFPLHTKDEISGLFRLAEYSKTQYTMIIEHISFYGAYILDQSNKKMKELTIDNCNCTEFIIRGAAVLESLRIINCPYLKQISLNDDYPKLKTVYLNNLPVLTSFVSQNLSCSVELYDLPQFASSINCVRLCDERKEKKPVSYSDF